MNISHYLSLGNAVDDLADQLKSKLDAIVQDEVNFFQSKLDAVMQHEADVVYDRFRVRLDQDKEGLADDLIKTMTPRLEAAATDIIANAKTAAFLGEQHQKFEQDVRNGILPVVIGGVLFTLAGTFLITKLVKR